MTREVPVPGETSEARRSSQTAMTAAAARAAHLPLAAQRGEPWLTFLTPDECTAMLRDAEFTEVHQVSPVDAVPDGMWRRDDALLPSGLAMLAHATV